MRSKSPVNTPFDKPSLLIVDDHVLCCEGLVKLFETTTGIGKVVAATAADEAVHIAEAFRPDVALVDIALPEDGAFVIARKIQALRPRSRVVFLDDEIQPMHVCEALRAGAAGYWTKYAPFQDVAEAVRRAAAGETVFCPAVQEQLTFGPAGVCFKPMLASAGLSSLTPREMEVLTFLAGGLSVKECAQRMRLSSNTVDNHKSRLMKKLGIHRTAELVRFAIREGLVGG